MNHSLLPSIGTASLPAKYEAARMALTECGSVDECKDWADKSAALASYARQSQDEEMEKMAMRIRARAVRRCGELLKEVEKAKNQHDASARGAASPTRIKAAADAGLSKDQAKDAIRVANVPTQVFEQQVESDKPPTITALADQGKRPAAGKPLYERLGMTKQQFQAGMYFRGDIENYIKAMDRHEIRDVVAGSTPEERKTIKANLITIDSYHKELRAAL